MEKKVLLAEEEEDIINLLQNKFIKEGYAFFNTRDGVETLKKIQEIKPDLILIDVFLPKMTGLEIAAKISKDPVLKETPIIVIFNSRQPEEINQARDLGVKNWVFKTEFEPQDIINKVIQQIGK